MPEWIVETQGLVRRFGEHTAVDHVDLQVPPQSIYGFLGPNGAGKSTTIRLLLGLLKADAGTVRLFGRRVGLHRRMVLERVGALIEGPSVYEHLTGRENVEVTRRLRGTARSRVDRVLEAVGLRAEADRRVQTYSLGMKQRLGLALALLPDPELLVLDEPTNGLDPAGRKDVRALIRTLPERTGATVVLSSHLLDEVERTATHVSVIRAGRLVFQDTIEALAERKQRRVLLGAGRPAEAMRRLAQVGVEARLEAGEQRLVVEGGDRATAARCTALLVGGGFDVHHVAVEESSLEDAFLQLTDSHEEAATAA